MINIDLKVIIIGIYKITSPSGKVYIGQAIHIYKRWSNYYKLCNCKQQVKLLNSLKKYGIKSHKFEILEKCKVEELNDREVYYKQLELDKVNGDWTKVLFCRLYDKSSGPLTDEIKQNIKNSYTHEVRERMSKAKKGITKYSEESKLKMSLGKKGKPLSEKHLIRIKNQKTKKINQYDLEGNFIKEWKSQKEILNELKIRVGFCVTNKTKTAGGFIWKY